MCPVCNQFEQLYGDAIADLVDDGTITLNIHPISILDRASLGHGVLHSCCERDVLRRGRGTPDASVPFMQAMFANQPAEGSTGLTDEQILELAAGVGVTGIDACVNDGQYTRIRGRR